ncbi:Alpha/Beta hydrolase protein [Triangularia verruculosa]|uniref:Alpha/Beta hydrolase protein n=1 Tax=Triangularia verruculosa TaxID=2587418 RepID=A0AAN7ASJ5_9PEZI|nr:Alpha/Beta hydrolase protein [Triangularia verruculosa]
MDPNAYPPPPGQTRPHAPPTRTGTVRFRIPSVNEIAETSYSIWGNLSSKKVPLICIHGGPGIPHDYLLPVSLISTDYTIPVVMYDQVGCGRSTRFHPQQYPPNFFTVDLFLAELDNLIRSLGITVYDLLGHSWGGMLASSYAITQPTGLRKLILCSTPSDMRTFVQVGAELRSCLPQDIQASLSNPLSPEHTAATMELHRRHLCRVEPCFPVDLMTSLQSLAEDDTVHNAMNGGSSASTSVDITGSLKNWSVVSELGSVTEKTVPGGVLLINGYFDSTQDACVLPWFSRTKARVKWVQFALSSSMPHLEETNKFVKVVGRFLTTHC